MKFPLFFPLLLFCQSSLAQATLKGYVTLQNSGGKSAFPASVKSYGASDTDVKSEDGSFALVYDRFKPGKDVVLDVMKPNYEVVNKEALSARIPESAETQKRLKIWLCPAGQWQRYADEYYGINQRTVLANYEKKLKELQAKYKNATWENQELSDALSQLAQEKDAALAQAQELAEKLAKTNLDDATDRFRKAFDFFTKGNMDSVLLVLQEEAILADLARARKEKAEGQELIKIGREKIANAEEALEKIVEELMMKARAHVQELQWEEAKRTYELAIAADTTNVDNLWEVGDFFREQNDYQPAMRFYKKTLQLAQLDSYRAALLNNLGLLLHANNSFGEAEKAYQEALKIYQMLAAKNPEYFLPGVATSYNNLGTLLSDQQSFAEAEAAFQEALKIQRVLAATNPDAFLPHVAGSLNNLGLLFHRSQSLDEADDAYREALKIYLPLAVKNPDAYLPSVAITLNNLGNLYQSNDSYIAMDQEARQGALKIAEEAYRDAIKAYLVLAVKNRDAFLPDIAATLSNLGALLTEKQNFEEAKVALQESLKIQRTLVKKNPGTFLHDMAITLNNLGSLLKEKESFAEAEGLYQEALKVYLSLAEKNPDAYTLYVGITELNLGIFYGERCESTKDLRHCDKGLVLLQDAIKRLVKISAENPSAENYLRRVILWKSRIEYVKMKGF